jgi:hypothetical protein
VRASPLRLGALALVAALAAAPFFWATTFFSDDHLFLTFARLAPSPFVPFASDQHGGEFYRPIPWALWWLLGRLGSPPPAWPFALLGLTLHGVVAIQLGVLIGLLGRGRAAATTAGALFFLGPATRETALWFVAAPDLMAAAAVLGSLIALVRGRTIASVALAAVAYFCKESALTLPLLALVVIAAAPGAGGVPWRARWRRRALAVVPHAVVAILFFAIRWRILGGLGGTGDQRASPAVKLVQLASGFVQLIAGSDVVPEPLAWGLGVGALGLAAYAAGRAARRGDRWGLAPVVFAGLAALPMLGAGWLVGARYFYLSAVGVAWLAGEGLARGGDAARVVVVLALLVLGGLQAIERHDEVTSYDRRVAAARRAVADGARAGHRVFHVVSGVKDLDLAVKEAPELAPFRDRILVLGDVPASFAIIPSDLEQAAEMLVASPPLPPSGAYRFGDRRVVGLARRGDEPALDELLIRFPDARFIRLRLTPGGHVIARDATEEVRSSLD